MLYEVITGEQVGANLYLTLDRTIQYLAEKELAAGVKKVGAKGGRNNFV